jgi:2-polyprenyl-6-methoxyphenol hydroxylase-like FAD-dependent oxidoreductase
MPPPTVLVSGAGIAGPTLAYWLARHGLRPTVVERSRGLRSSGNPVDVRGPALPVAERMGIVPRLHDAATVATAMCVLDAAGRPVGRIPLPGARGPAAGREVELPRGDLAAILHEAARDDAEFLFDETIVALRQDEGGVDVTLDHGGPRRFDLVIGADGLHSTVRRLAFGPERDFVRHLGLYVATMRLGGPADPPHDLVMYNLPGRLVALHPSRADAVVVFIFRSPAIDGLDHRDTGQHREVLGRAYAGAGWRVPELLELARATDDLYFDAVSVVRLATWARGRVALVGDAASCVSLFGDGSSLAMAGAFSLAEALGVAGTDHAAAFRRYEAEHRGRVRRKQQGIRRATMLLVPRTRVGIAARNLAIRLLGGRR